MRHCLGICGLVLAFATPSTAETIYTYTGDTLTQFAGSFSCPPECAVSGWFAVSDPLAANLANATVVPDSFSFTDGATTWTNGNVLEPNFDGFHLSTDASGDITSWGLGPQIGYSDYLYVYTTAVHVGDQVPGSQNDLTLSQHYDGGCNCYVVDGYAGDTTAGSWSETTTPEPSTAALLLLAAAVGFGLRRGSCNRRGA